MQTNTHKKYSGQPDENVSPEVKASEEWGLQCAEYIIHHQNGGLQAFHNAKGDYDRWRLYAVGKQDQGQYKPVIRMDPKASKQEHLLSIRQDVKNYATNIVNIVVSKINARKYDPVVDPKDPLALDQKKEFKAKVQAYIEQREFLESIGLGQQARAMNAEIPDDLMPDNVTELDIYMELNYKMEQAIKLEKAISDALEKNSFYDVTSRLYAKDLVVCGPGAIFTGLDQNNEALVRYIDVANMLVPFSERGDWKNAKYMAHKEWMTLADLKTLNKTLSDNDFEEIKKHSRNNTGTSVLFDDVSSGDYLNQQDVEKYEVVHFEYKTTNQKVFLKKQDKGGNVRMHKKDWNYYADPEKMESFKKKYKGEREIIRKNHQAIYSGYYIVGTDYVMNYGLKNNIETPNGPWGQTVFGYKVFAPDYYNGHISSLMGQMEPILDDLQEYSLKIREHLAQPFPDGVMLDLHALRKAASSFKWKGKQMTEQDILEMAYQNKVLLFDGSVGKYAPGSSYKPVHSLGDGSGEVAKYIQLIGQSLMELERITGLNQVTMAASLDKKAGKGVTEMQQQASEVALDHLYDAKKYLCQEVYKSVGTLVLQAAKFGGKKGDINRDVTKHTYDFVAEARPTDYEWTQFYQELTQLREAGMITAGDLATVRQIRNLKEARAYLTVTEKKKQRDAAQREQANNEFNIQSQQQSAQMSHQAKLAEIQAKYQGDSGLKQIEIQLEKIRHQNKMAELEKQIELETMSKMSLEDQKARYESKIVEEKAEEDRETKLAVEEKRSRNKEVTAS